MLASIRKSWILNRKNVLLGFVLAVLFSLITLDSQKYYSVALMMCPSFLFTYLVGKMCYFEDASASKQFLLSMPISKKDLIAEKNYLSFLSIFIGLVLAIGSSAITDVMLKRELLFDLKLILGVILALVLYNTVYISLNYCFDYSITQFTPYLLLVFMLILFKFGDKVMLFFARVNLVGLILLLLGELVANYFVIHVLSKRCKLI